MLSHPSMRRAGMNLRPIRPTCFATAVALGTIALVIAGCAAPATNPQVANPADASARLQATSYRSVVSGYESSRPSDPLPWRERNERVTPEAKP